MLISCSVLATAQKYELGGRVGFGTFTAEDVGTPLFTSIGVELCALCSGRFAAFVEYSHWLKSGDAQYSSYIENADTFGGGLRIQRRDARIRPFFDVGIVGARDSYTYWGGSNSHGSVGMVLGGGVAFRLGERAYVRPQFRVYATSGFHAAYDAGVGFGFRF
jgi:hypothetical protein